MPELPEVETVRRGLESILSTNTRIEKIELRRGDLRQKVTHQELAVFEGQPILAVRRRAKYLLLDTPEHTLLSHLGMTGSWRLLEPGQDKKHDHCLIHLADGRRLVFHDPRRFGLIIAIARTNLTQHRALVALGPEPLDSEFNAQYVFAKTRKKQTGIKTWLMDQRNVVGVGNIYASEALYLARIRPQVRSAKLSIEKCAKLVKAVQKVLHKAIDFGGTTISDYRQAGGQSGKFQTRLLVYDRAGQPCRSCRKPIRRQVMTGRSTYWCQNCQS